MKYQHLAARKLSAARLAIIVENFNRHGHHVSPTGLTMAPLLCYLEQHKIAFTLTYSPTTGYLVRKLDERQ